METEVFNEDTVHGKVSTIADFGMMPRAKETLDEVRQW